MIRRAGTTGRILGLIVIISLNTLFLGAAPEKERSVPKRVLFIGNSYTAQIKEELLHMLAHSPYQETTFEFITKGGATLQQFLTDGSTLKRIRTGKWDVVILQEQSQRPALPGKYEKSFHMAAAMFTLLVRSAGAEPVLFMTWGRRDGDVQNRRLFPDYATMQKRLSEAYRTAAKKNEAILAPVGQAWFTVQQWDKALWRNLYARDGSHPSSRGAHLASCVFFRVLFGDSLESVQSRDKLSNRERHIIREAVLSVTRVNNKQTK